MAMDAGQLQREFAETLGNLYAGYGWKRLDGLIIGLLLAKSTQLSLDDISRELNRSKGPISESVRQLTAKRLLRKAAGPENRRDYYVIDPEIFHHNHLLNMQVVHRNRMVAEDFLSRDTGEAMPDGMRGNLRTMHAFYTLMERFYSDFSVRWKQEQRKLEEYGY
ncbi:MAG: MarR family transcriptional regulator [Bacteroidetes bacterium]|nr:MarR family transcriptional regulator [Bacteroidota bacterium]